MPEPVIGTLFFDLRPAHSRALPGPSCFPTATPLPPADLRSMQGCWHLIPQLVVIQSLSTGHHLIPLDCLPSDPSQLLAIQSRSTARHPIPLNCSPSDPAQLLAIQSLLLFASALC
ncbi:hypothetical protein PtA15_6A221 [Puccinia triticina]|uniref:Uncharacterized protein n=1 Tax=Puccinia triticina TaxID=208348 RepID=A0ABY7CKZ1_9BASI|nr:uncharacterized protein PtA15_6A221 [Puccinia triticina]WAQ85593.1 hypothetical protein PtA15_6A221 [Puccinia triticina]